MAEVAFVVDPAGWQHAFRSWSGPVGIYLRAKTVETRFVASVEAPRPGGMPRNRTGISYATGRLASSHITSYQSAGIGRDLEGRVIAMPRYAGYVHGGTRPHMIFPKHGTHLHFFWHKHGKFVSLPYVHHPGTMANPWLVRALEKVFG